VLDELELDGTSLGTDPMPGGDDNYDDFDDGLVESLIIIGLVATLAFLVYYRQQRQLQNRRNAAAAVVNAQPAQGAADAQQQAAGAGAAQPAAQPGIFPNPGDPDWNQWVAGGVGH